MLSRRCKVEGCSKKVHAKGFCTRHYAQWRQYGLINEDGKPLREAFRVPLKFQDDVCCYPGCGNEVRTRGWCNKHYLQFRSGIIGEDNEQLRDPKFRPGRGWRTYCRGYRKVMSKGHPFADRDGYILEHRLVMEEHLGRHLESGEVVHHINGVKDDNRIENLQLRSSRADHGHGHEKIEDVEKALLVLEQLINHGISGGAEIKKRLQRIARRI